MKMLIINNTLMYNAITFTEKIIAQIPLINIDV